MGVNNFKAGLFFMPPWKLSSILPSSRETADLLLKQSAGVQRSERRLLLEGLRTGGAAVRTHDFACAARLAAEEGSHGAEGASQPRSCQQKEQVASEGDGRATSLGGRVLES